MIKRKPLSKMSQRLFQKNLGAPKENIHVILEEMKKTDYGVAGVRKSDI